MLVAQSGLTLPPHGLASQATLSMQCSRQESWSGLPFPSPGDLPDPGIKSGFPALKRSKKGCMSNSLPNRKPTTMSLRINRRLLYYRNICLQLSCIREENFKARFLNSCVKKRKRSTGVQPEAEAEFQSWAGAATAPAPPGACSPPVRLSERGRGCRGGRGRRRG